MLTGINETIFNQMKDIYVSEGCTFEEAKDKAINLIIDLNTTDKDIKEGLEEIAKRGK